MPLELGVLSESPLKHLRLGAQHSERCRNPCLIIQKETNVTTVILPSAAICY